MQEDPSPLEAKIQNDIKALAVSYASWMMPDHELFDIGMLLTRVPWKRGDFVVEIGAYQGQTSVFLAKVLRSIGLRFVPVVSIDPFERSSAKDDTANPAGSARKYLEAVSAAGLEDQCFAVQTFSSFAAPAIADRIGLLLIDGSHAYQDCLADLTRYVPKVIPGGFVVIDDFDLCNYPGVVQAVEDYFGARPQIRVHHPVGYAVVRIEERNVPQD